MLWNCDMAVDMGGVYFLCFCFEGFAFETLVFGGKEMSSVNLSLFDDCTAFSYLSVLLITKLIVNTVSKLNCTHN